MKKNQQFQNYLPQQSQLVRERPAGQIPRPGQYHSRPQQTLQQTDQSVTNKQTGVALVKSGQIFSTAGRQSPQQITTWGNSNLTKNPQQSRLTSEYNSNLQPSQLQDLNRNPPIFRQNEFQSNLHRRLPQTDVQRHPQSLRPRSSNNFHSNIQTSRPQNLLQNVPPVQRPHPNKLQNSTNPPQNPPRYHQPPQNDFHSNRSTHQSFQQNPASFQRAIPNVSHNHQQTPTDFQQSLHQRRDFQQHQSPSQHYPQNDYLSNISVRSQHSEKVAIQPAGPKQGRTKRIPAALAMF